MRSANNSLFSQHLKDIPPKMNDITFFNEEMILSHSFKTTPHSTLSSNDSRGESNPNDEKKTPQDKIKGQNVTMP